MSIQKNVQVKSKNTLILFKFCREEKSLQDNRNNMNQKLFETFFPMLSSDINIQQDRFVKIASKEIIQKIIQKKRYIS